MIRQAFDRRELERYLAGLRDQLDAPELQDVAARAAGRIGGAGSPTQKLRAALASADGMRGPAGGADDGDVPFTARDPLVSLVQSSLESALRARDVADVAPGHPGFVEEAIEEVRSLLHPDRYGPRNPEWVIEIGKATLERLARGNHPFNPSPATHEISDQARVVIVGDWGSGLPRARAVATVMAEEVADALADGRDAHVVHLGDVYYSGLPEEYRRNLAAPGMWPVTAERARAGVTSWSLNGNHDMYGGGFGYFDTLSTDQRFAAQRSADGSGTSFFRLVSPSWEFIGLDTSWERDVLAAGQTGVLEDPQAAYVESVASQSDRRLVLLSHHQLLSVYEPDTGEVGRTLAAKLAPVLSAHRVTAWLWGHEHRCMGFRAAGGVAFPRCIGHGGFPVLMTHGPDDAVPAPGAWEERGFLVAGGRQWARFGCAILDLSPTRIDVRYRDEQGRTSPRREQFS